MCFEEKIFVIRCGSGRWKNYYREFFPPTLFLYDYESDEMKYLGYFLNEKLSLDTIKYYYDKTIGKGDYYKLDKAIEKVNLSNHTPGTKEKLINVLKEVNSNRSIWKAKISTGYTKERFSHFLKLLRDLEINPVTIPRRWSINYLENLEDKIQ